MIDPKIIEMSGKANKEMICFKPKAVRIFEGTNMLFRFFFPFLQCIYVIVHGKDLES